MSEKKKFRNHFALFLSNISLTYQQRSLKRNQFKLRDVKCQFWSKPNKSGGQFSSKFSNPRAKKLYTSLPGYRIWRLNPKIATTILEDLTGRNGHQENKTNFETYKIL